MLYPLQAESSASGTVYGRGSDGERIEEINEAQPSRLVAL